MHSHEPPGYTCPFCRFMREGRTDNITQGDVVHRDDATLAFIAPRWWPNNKGHVLVVPTGHHENLYTIPRAAGHAVHDTVQRVAIAVRETYGCQGVSTRQHNEPVGHQDVWHFHVHVYPRYEGDQLYKTVALPGFATAEERRPYAERLRAYLSR